MCAIHADLWGIWGMQNQANYSILNGAGKQTLIFYLLVQRLHSSQGSPKESFVGDKASGHHENTNT